MLLLLARIPTAACRQQQNIPVRPKCEIYAVKKIAFIFIRAAWSLDLQVGTTVRLVLQFAFFGGTEVLLCGLSFYYVAFR